MTIVPVGSPQAGRFFQDIGHFGITGVVTDRPAGQTVQIWRWDGTAKAWHQLGTTKTDNGLGYATSSIKVTWGSATMRFCATLGGSPATASVVKTCPAPIRVIDATVKLDKPAGTVDSLKNETVSGRVYPARAGVRVNLDVLRSDKQYRSATTVTSRSDGRFTASLGYGAGNLSSYRVRAAYHAANRDRWEKSSNQTFTRVAVLNATVAHTTSADVAKTYRSGCPVGPSKLRTISMNFYGADHTMHRGVIIIRTDLTDDLIRAFGTALSHRFPIDKMNNPNVYGGNDPKQMEAGNTSGFNCRKVTGNPYAQSPHSYGTALDVNTKENPYRDVHGKWWPTSGKSYIKRSPVRSGMLTSSSALTKSLVKDHFFWGANWYPGRDYQHFQR